MVYESDFYTTRRPYRSSPSYSTYTTSVPLSRQIRVLPGLGKVHIVHTYDRIVPYVGHKRLTVVTLPPKVYSTRSTVLQREYDRIENKLRPWVGYSPTNRYLNSDSYVRYVYVRNPYTGIKYYTDYVPSRYYNFYRIIRPLSSYYDYWPYERFNYYSWPFYRSLGYYDDYPLSRKVNRTFDDETRLIRAQTASLLKQIHLPVSRIRTWPLAPLNRYGDFGYLPAKFSNDTYIHRLLTLSPGSNKIQYATYYTEPVKKYIGKGHLACVSYTTDRSYDRRNPLAAIYEDTLRNDIQLLSYYINRFRQEKTQPKEVPGHLPAARPSRIFSVHKPLDDPVAKEVKDLKEARAARLAKIYATDSNVENAAAIKKKKEEAQLAEERAIAEEQARKEAQAKKEKEEAARKAELERQEQLAAQAAAERAAELERQAEQARQEELAKQAELERIRQEEEEKLRQEEERLRQEEEERLRQEEEERLRQEEEERLRQEEEERRRQEEERRLEEEARAEEERQQLLRLEEIARQAEEEKEAELARQAQELAELARQEAELAELERQERELAELEKQEAELAAAEQGETEVAAPDEDNSEVVKEEEDAEKVETEVADDQADEPIVEVPEESGEDAAEPEEDIEE